MAMSSTVNDADYGAVICEFNKGGVNQALCQFKQHDGKVRDEWTVKTNVPHPNTTPTSGTDHKFIVSKPLSGRDDVVEEAGGRQDCDNAGLELATARTVGIRFGKVDLDPSHAKHVVAARIDFTVKTATTDESAEYVIRAEQAKSSSELCGSKPLSERAKTTKQVVWRPQPWDGSGENIRAGGVVSSPNLAAVVKDIVSTGWQKGGPMTFFISGKGGRVVHSFDQQDPSLAPKLVIELEETAAQPTSSPKPTSKPTSRPSSSRSCPAVSTWKDVKYYDKLECPDCTALAYLKNVPAKTCAGFCALQKLECVKAWEDKGNDCEILEERTCDFVNDDTTDVLCNCVTKSPGNDYESVTVSASSSLSVSLAVPCLFAFVTAFRPMQF
jgi:hypothetical protein